MMSAPQIAFLSYVRGWAVGTVEVTHVHTQLPPALQELTSANA